MSPSFDELADQRQPRKGICRLCGSRNAGVVGVTLTSARGGVTLGQIATRSVTLCEQHASELFVLLRAELDQVRGGTLPEEL